MALVAYGSSGESDYSDEEENATFPSAPTVKVIKSDTSKTQTFNIAAAQTSSLSTESKIGSGDGSAKVPTPTSALLDVDRNIEQDADGASQISDDEEFALEQTVITTGLSLPAPKNAVTVASLEQSTASTSTNLLAGLPKPQAPESSSIIDDREDELEDFVKKKETPAEKPPSKKRLPVKITIPSLRQNDSDEDDDVPTRKKTKITSGSSLFAMLPPPQHAPIKEIKRSLVPHSLTKRPTKPLTPIPKSSPPAFPRPATKISHLPGVPEDDSDEEEGAAAAGCGGNFFSLGQSSASSSSSTASSSSSYMSRIASTIHALPMDVAAPPPLEALTKTMSQGEPAEDVAPSDAPLSFKPRAGGYSSSSQWGRAAGGVSVNQMYNLANVQEEEEAGSSTTVPGPSTAAYGDPDEPADVDITKEDEMLRLAGKRQFRREELNIIDVHQEDQIDRAELLKSISEEDGATAAYAASHSKSKDLPGGQSKRKHQITYLGQLAKARELDLKNQWAQNKMSKRQSAMKYGF